MTVAARRPSSTSSFPPFGSPSQPRNGTRPHSDRRPPRAVLGPPRHVVVLAHHRARGGSAPRSRSRSHGVDRLLRARRRPLAVHHLEVVRTARATPPRRPLSRRLARGRRPPAPARTARDDPSGQRPLELAGVNPPDLDVIGGHRRDRESRALACQGVHVGRGAVEEEPTDAGPGRVLRDPLEPVGDARVDRGAPPAALLRAHASQRNSCWICSTPLSSAKRTSTSTPTRRPASRASSPCNAWYSWSALVRETTMRSAIGGDYRRSASAERASGRRGGGPFARHPLARPDRGARPGSLR